MVGVPDSTLKEFCAYLEDGIGFDHRCAANEGAAVGMAMGAYLPDCPPPASICRTAAWEIS